MAQQLSTAPLTPPASPTIPPATVPATPPTTPPVTSPLHQQSRHQKIFASFFAAGSPTKIKVDNPYRQSTASNKRPRLPKSQHFRTRAESMKYSSTIAAKSSSRADCSNISSTTTNAVTSDQNESPKVEGTLEEKENRDAWIKIKEVLNDVLLYEAQNLDFYEKETNYFDLQFEAELDFIEGRCIRIE